MPQNLLRREAEYLYADPPDTRAGLETARSILRLLRQADLTSQRVRFASGLTEKEFSTLRFLSQSRREGRPASPKDLTDALGVTTAAVTHIIDHLEELGDLERVINPRDRRGRVIGITDAGETKVHDFYGRFHQSIARALDDLDPDTAAVVRAVLDATTAQLAEDR